MTTISSPIVKHPVQSGSPLSVEHHRSSMPDASALHSALDANDLHQFKALTKQLRANQVDINEWPGEKSLVKLAVENVIKHGDLNALEHLVQEGMADFWRLHNGKSAGAHAIEYADAQMNAAKSVDPGKADTINKHVQIVVKYLSNIADTHGFHSPR